MPASDSTGTAPDAALSWRAGREATQSTVYLSTDPNEVADGIAPSATSNTNSIDLSSFDLQMGTTYYWRAMFFDNLESGSEWADPYRFTTVRASDVTIADTILTLKVISGMDTNQTISELTDVDGDGHIGLSETIYILQQCAGTR